MDKKHFANKLGKNASENSSLLYSWAAMKLRSCGGNGMYTCDDAICDPCCDFCWYCIHGNYGEPKLCIKMKSEYDDGFGYCDEFRCCLHEPKPLDI